MRYLLYKVMLLAFLTGVTRVKAQSYKVLAAKGTTESNLQEVARAVAAADVVFIGEQHDDSLAHAVQTALFKELHQIKGKDLALSMEMFETDCQSTLNEYLAGFITEKQLISDARAWGNYKDYRPMVEFAKEQQLAVIAANAPRRYVNLVARKGMKVLDSLPKASRQWLPKLPFDTLSGRYYEKFSALMGGHGSANIYYSQNLWDATMSNSIHLYKKEKKNRQKLVYHLCGRFHSDEYTGTVAHLQQKNKKLVVKTISCIPEEQAAVLSAEELGALADYVVITYKDK